MTYVGPQSASDITIGLSKGDSNNAQFNRKASSGANTISYQLYKAKQTSTTYILKDSVTDDTTHLIVNNLIKNKPKTITYYMYVPPQQNSQGNLIYQDHLRATILGTSQVVPFRISISIPPIFNLTPSTTDLNFSVLSTGQLKSFLLLVKSNMNYDLSIQSQNNSELKNTQYPDAMPIPYQCTVGSTTYSLTSGAPVVFLNDQTQTPAAGSTSTARIQIIDAKNKTAGTYKDNLIINLIER